MFWKIFMGFFKNRLLILRGLQLLLHTIMMTSFKYDDVIMYDSISLTAKIYYKGVTYIAFRHSPWAIMPDSKKCNLQNT